MSNKLGSWAILRSSNLLDKKTDFFGSTDSTAPDVLKANARALKKTRVYPDRCPGKGLAETHKPNLIK